MSRHIGSHHHTRIQPTRRDRAIFAYLAELGLASSAQIRARFWSEAKLQTCVDRLEKLVSTGYLSGEYTTARGRVERVYWMGRKARRMLPAGDERAAAGRPAEAEMAHLLRTREVVDLFFRSGRLISFTSEHQLKREAATGAKALARGAQANARRSEVADGRLVLAVPHEGGGGEGALETSAAVSAGVSDTYQQDVQQDVLLEIDGAYYGQRLLAKVAALAAAPLPVLWVTGTRTRLTRLQALCAPYPQLHPILFADLLRAYATPTS